MHILTANSWFKMTFMQFRRLILLKELERYGLKDMGCDSDVEPLMAWVSQGRWSVTCPCGGGEYAWEEGWMMCHSCFNGYMGHKFRRTVFPNDRKDIEALLLVRPLQKREWHIGETLADLLRENEEHADELLRVEPLPGTPQNRPVALSAIGMKYGREASPLDNECESCIIGEPPSDPTSEIEYLREHHPEKLAELEAIEAEDLKAHEGGDQ